MKAALYEAFAAPLKLVEVPDPVPPPMGVVLEVKATGLCRSDWHGWMGHDPDIRLPHVPGHEMSGVIEALGERVFKWKVGDRVTVPFVCGCGVCPQCQSGNHQVCDHPFQPGFTHWGSFAEYVAIDYADVNLVRLPEAIEFTTAASLGCRFATAFRAVVTQGRVSAGQWVAVYGCGGVGLSVIMIASALGASVVAIDIRKEALELATSLGAVATLHAGRVPNVVEAVRERTQGGAHLSIDALGSPQTCYDSIDSLRKRGRHVQVGLLLGNERHPLVPMDRIIAHELEILGSHGMQAHCYPEMLEMIGRARVRPDQLIGRTISLEESLQAFVRRGRFEERGVTVIDRF